VCESFYFSELVSITDKYFQSWEIDWTPLVHDDQRSVNSVDADYLYDRISVWSELRASKIVGSLSSDVNL
jgi:hypothetical protein